MAEGPKLNAVGEKCKKEIENWETSFKRWWGNLPENLLAEGQRHHETCATLVEPWRTFHGNFQDRTFWQPKTDRPHQRHHENWRILVEPSAEPFGSPRRALVEPSPKPKPFGSPRGMWPREPDRVRNAILPRNLYYGWIPESYCCWGRNKLFNFFWQICVFCIFPRWWYPARSPTPGSTMEATTSCPDAGDMMQFRVNKNPSETKPWDWREGLRTSNIPNMFAVKAIVGSRLGENVGEYFLLASLL